MLKLNAASIKGYKEMTIPFTLVSQGEKSKKLAIILPGKGYTV